MKPLPLLLDCDQLAAQLDQPELLLLDLSSLEQYRAGHIPGAIHLDPSRLMCGQQPVPNKLPSAEQLSQLFSELGLTDNSRIVAYDDMNGALAGRLIWTLDIIGHPHGSVLNGQLPAWIASGQPLEQSINDPVPSHYSAKLDRSLVADKDDILNQLDASERVIWDARSLEEYRGDKVVNAIKGGHIPGARHFLWTDVLVSSDDLRLKPNEQLRGLLEQQGITPDKEVITHCQTHRRSGLTYLAAKALGYPRIRCYDGSWFEWGNAPDTPVET